MKLLKQRKLRLKFLEENLLKTFYALGEKNQDFQALRRNQDLQNQRRFPPGELKAGLKRLERQGFVSQSNDGSWAMSQDGLNKGKKIQRLHRLWELYLTQYLKIAPDHVHEDAESIEHILTPELEKQLEELLNDPSVDPHKSVIPK